MPNPSNSTQWIQGSFGTPAISPIQNDLKGGDLAVTVLTDPNTIQFYVETMANQINAARMKHAPAKNCVDLSKFIADIIVDTTCQGASLLEVHVIDPNWWLLQRDANGVCFIDADESGYLWPPIDVNFPPDVSDSWWRLAQIRVNTDLASANLIMTFEDKAVAELRECYGPEISNANESRAAFIRRLVSQANQRLQGRSVSAETNITGTGQTIGTTTATTTGTSTQVVKTVSLPGIRENFYQPIRFIPLFSRSTPNAFSAFDLAISQVAIPASAAQPKPPPARTNPAKKAAPALKGANLVPPAIVGNAGPGVGAALSIAEGFSTAPNGGLLTGNGSIYVPPETFGSASNPMGVPAAGFQGY